MLRVTWRVLPAVWLLIHVCSACASAAEQPALSREDVKTLVLERLGKIKGRSAISEEESERLRFENETYCLPLDFLPDPLLTTQGAKWYVDSVLKTVGDGAMYKKVPWQELKRFRKEFVAWAKVAMAQKYASPKTREARKRHMVMYLTGFAEMLHRILIEEGYVSHSKLSEQEWRQRLWTYVDGISLAYYNQCESIFFARKAAVFDKILCPGATEGKFLRLVLARNDKPFTTAPEFSLRLGMAARRLLVDVVRTQYGESVEDVAKRTSQGLRLLEEGTAGAGPSEPGEARERR